MSDEFPSVHFAEYSDKPFDWRGEEQEHDPDDELLLVTPEDIVYMLGFDPLEFDPSIALDKAWNEEDHPRVAPGRSTGGEFIGNNKAFDVGKPKEFIEARNKSSRSGFLSPTTPDDLAKHTLLMNKDKTVGIAVDPHGDIQNIFNNGGPKGGAAHAMVEALREGGKTLDCYDGFLPMYYRQFGFEETGRMKFNAEFAHGWDTAKQGTPDVVFMAWHGFPNGDADAAIERATSRKDWIENTESKSYGTDWDRVKEYSRTEAVQGGAETGQAPREAQGKKADPAGNKPGPGAGPRAGGAGR